MEIQQYGARWFHCRRGRSGCAWWCPLSWAPRGVKRTKLTILSWHNNFACFFDESNTLFRKIPCQSFGPSRNQWREASSDIDGRQEDPAEKRTNWEEMTNGWVCLLKKERDSVLARKWSLEADLEGSSRDEGCREKNGKWSRAKIK